MISKSHLISLSAVPGMGPRRIRALFKKYSVVANVNDILSEFQLQSLPKQVELLPKLNCEEELVFQ